MTRLRTATASGAIVLAILGASNAAAVTLGFAIITHDRASLRATPRDSAQAHAILRLGEAVEVRGERMDFLQIYDHRRERAGFVRASQVRRVTLKPEEAPELLSILRFLRGAQDAEALGIAFAAAYIQAAPAAMLNSEAGIEALDALGTLADRLARRASSAKGKDAQATISAHLEVAARYGISFTNNERGGRVQICYAGDAFRRVLAMRSNQEQRARAALALTRPECMPELRPLERTRMDEWRADVLDRVDADALPGYLRNRVLMRRASVWSSLAYQLARKGEAADSAAKRALAALAGVSKSELAHEDARAYSEAAMRVSASRWASVPTPAATTSTRPHIVTAPGDTGQTCILLLDAKHDTRHPQVKRCTYGIVWTGSATLNKEGTALALAVQPTDSWREMWIFHRSSARWTVRVLPPATTIPDVGYAEFAGWVPGGAQMLVAREALGEGKYKRNFELVRLDSLATVREARDPGALSAFQRWQDPSWKRQTLSVR
jgi:hypothetical protein